MTSWRDFQRKNGRHILEGPKYFVPGIYYWPVDFSVRGPGRGKGCAPDGHHRRCQSFAKYKLPNLVQCTRWAAKGRRVCKKHGGGKPLKQRVGRWYEHRAGPRLRELLEVTRQGLPEEQLSLLDELGIARALTGDTLDKWEKAHEQGSEELVRKADAALRASVEYICSIAEKASKVRAQSLGVVNAEHLDYVIGHVGRIIEKHLDKETAEKVMDDIAAMPLPTAANSHQTPAEFAKALRDAVGKMDATTGPVDQP